MANETERKWGIKYDIPAFYRELEAAGYNPLLSRVLSLSEEIKSVKDVEEFLSCETGTLHDPMLMKGMAEAVERIGLAVDRNEKVAVYGDYDVDGITSTCLLSSYLKGLGLDCEAYIPDRNDEGYGLNCGALDNFKKKGISLVITVDCGITAIEETEYARSLGIDMIVTDHHECKDSCIPDVCSVIDTKQPGDSYPNNHLAGVGVAFKLACACEGDSAPIIEKYSDLVAIGSVADVMPLIDENRILVRLGIEKLRSNPRPGIVAMLEDAGYEAKKLSATSISFTIAPRLNAAGRLGVVSVAQKLLMSTDYSEAVKYSEELCRLNRERQVIEKRIWEDADGLIKKSDRRPVSPIVLSKENWEQGVIGIAASRLSEQYALPTIMISINDDGIGKGSCRSYGGFNLFEALSACSDYLISYGGHALAAGLNIHKDKIDDFRSALADYYNKFRPEGVDELDCGIYIKDPSILSIENVRSLDLLEPFGNSNPRPLMCMTGVTLVSTTNVGGGKHMKCRISANGTEFDAIYFGHTADEFGIKPGDRIDICFTPQINEFRGTESVQLGINALRKYNTDICEDILSGRFNLLNIEKHFRPERPDFVKIWKSIPSIGQIKENISAILEDCPEDIAPERYCLSLMALLETGLLSGPNGKIWGSKRVNGHDKVDLESAPLMKNLKDISDD